MPTVLDIVSTGIMPAASLEAGATRDGSTATRRATWRAPEPRRSRGSRWCRRMRASRRRSRRSGASTSSFRDPRHADCRRVDAQYVSIYAPHPPLRRRRPQGVHGAAADGAEVALHAFQRAALGEPLASLLLDAVGTGKLTPTNEAASTSTSTCTRRRRCRPVHVIHEDYRARRRTRRRRAVRSGEVVEPQLVDVSAVDGRTEPFLGLEWATLWDGVVMRNSLEGYRAMAGHDGSPPSAPPRAARRGASPSACPSRRATTSNSARMQPTRCHDPSRLWASTAKTAAAVDESRQYKMAADVELHRAFEAAIAHAARKGDRLLVVNDTRAAVCRCTPPPSSAARSTW